MSAHENTQHHGTATQPSLTDLLAGYLQRQAEAEADGLAAPDLGGEVVLYEAGPVQPVDARSAWTESLAVVTHLAPKAVVKGWQAPPQWPALVAAHEPAFALAFSLGNFPQLVRDLHPLLHAGDLGELRPTGGQPLTAPALVDWATQTSGKRQYPQTVLALGTLRLARQFDLADNLVRGQDASVPAEWRALWENEKAALAWHRGRAEEARALWLGQPASVPVLFNQGVAALFLGDVGQAADVFGKAIARLPETTAWHHLAGLYRTLALARA